MTTPMLRPFSKRVGFGSLLVTALIMCADPTAQAVLHAVVSFIGVSPRVAPALPWLTKGIGLLAAIGVWLSHSATGTGGVSPAATSTSTSAEPTP